MLPNLPKINKTLEADFGMQFRNWMLRYHKRLPTSAFELKDARSYKRDALPFSAVSIEQERSGTANKSDKGNFIRVSAGTIGTADYIYLRNACSYIVIRYKKSIEMIDVETFILEKERSTSRSLTALRASEISVISIKLSTALLA